MENENLLLLNNILLSDNVVSDFYDAYLRNFEFKNWLLDIVPQIEDCEHQQQRTPWHKYNVLGHILHAVEEINKMTKSLPTEERRMLSYIMFFHDIGKPFCRKEKVRNGVVLDSFPNHPKKSAEIAQSVLYKFEFDGKQILEMAKLIEYHDIFIQVCESGLPINNSKTPITKQFVKGLMEEFSSVGNDVDMMKKLFKIRKADSLAQNENMTARSLEIVSRAEDIFNEIIEK